MNIDEFQTLLNENNYSYDRLIGEGCYGTVYCVKDMTDEKEYAANVYNIDRIKSITSKTNTEVVEFLLQQIESLKQFNNTNELITYHHHISTENHVILILDLYRGMTLGKHIESFNEKNIPEDVIVNILRQIVTGIYHIHMTDAAHKNLKPDNIFLLEDNTTVKIGHFGPLNSNDMNNNIPINKIRYLSPELINNDICNYKCCDIWSIGIIALDLCLGSYKIFPLILWSNDGINKIKIEYLRDIYSLKLLDFIIKCLTIDKNIRITIDQLIVHPLFGGEDNINYDDLNLNKTTEMNSFLDDNLLLKKPMTTESVRPNEDLNDNIDLGNNNDDNDLVHNNDNIDLVNNNDDDSNKISGDLLNFMIPGGSEQLSGIDSIDGNLIQGNSNFSSLGGGLFKSTIMESLDNYKKSQEKDGYAEINLDAPPEEGGLEFIERNKNNNDDDLMGGGMTQTYSTHTENTTTNEGTTTYTSETTYTTYTTSSNTNITSNYDFGDLMGTNTNTNSIEPTGNNMDNLFDSFGEAKPQQEESQQDEPQLVDLGGFGDLTTNNEIQQFIIINTDNKYSHVNVTNSVGNDTIYPGLKLSPYDDIYQVTLDCPQATISFYNEETGESSSQIDISEPGTYSFFNDELTKQ